MAHAGGLLLSCRTGGGCAAAEEDIPAGDDNGSCRTGRSCIAALRLTPANRRAGRSLIGGHRSVLPLTSAGRRGGTEPRCGRCARRLSISTPYAERGCDFLGAVPLDRLTLPNGLSGAGGLSGMTVLPTGGLSRTDGGYSGAAPGGCPRLSGLLSAAWAIGVGNGRCLTRRIAPIRPHRAPQRPAFTRPVRRRCRTGKGGATGMGRARSCPCLRRDGASASSMGMDSRCLSCPRFGG